MDRCLVLAPGFSAPGPGDDLRRSKPHAFARWRLDIEVPGSTAVGSEAKTRLVVFAVSRHGARVENLASNA
jgi:hypothetical protein